MPRKYFLQSIAAGAVFNPLDGWDYEFLPWPATVEMTYSAEATGIVATITSGSDRLTEEDPVPILAAAVLPTPFNAPVLYDEAAARDRLKMSFRNTSGGAVIVKGYVDIKPIGT